jgi:hypothetical protein
MTVLIPRGCFLLLLIIFGFIGISFLAKGETGPGLLTLGCVGVGVLRLLFEKGGR